MKKSNSSCAVAKCNNYGRKTNGVVYHRFPRDAVMQKEWISRCRRASEINVKNARICSVHFLPEDYERDLKNELLGLPLNKKLKVGAVPSQHLLNWHEEKGVDENKSNNGITEKVMEVTSASVIKIEPLVEDSEDCLSEEPSSIQCEPEEVFLVMPKTEPDHPEPEESIKEEYPDYHGINPEVCIEEDNSDDGDILYKCEDWGEPDNIIAPGTRQFWCSVCNKGFLRKAHLLRHVPIHNEQKDFKCDICLKEFTEKCSLKNHLLKHSNKKPFQCTICCRGYFQKSSLKKHVIAQHTKTQMIHSCTVCGRHFADVESLQDHLRSHIQLKKYTCKICSRDFCDKSGLNKHSVVHSNEKRFECPHCEKKFGRSDHLKIHIRVHTGKREHACPTCGKTFYLKGALVKHLLVHTKEKKYQCPKCFKKFGRVDHFNVHLVKQHSINDTSCKESESIKSSLPT